MMMKRPLLISILIVTVALTAWAAFVSTENFDSYTTGANLNGSSGGTGWGNNWSGTNGEWTVETAPAGMSGKAARNTIVNGVMQRGLSASITAGTVRVNMQISITNPNDFMGVVLQDSGLTARMYVRFGPTGNLELYDSGTTSYVSFGTYSANTTYTIDIDFDDSAQPDKYRARVNGGTYSGYKTVDGGAYSNIGGVRIDGSATGTRTLWIDDITTPPTGSAIPTLLMSRRRR